MPKKYNIVEIYIKLLFALPYVPRAFQPLRTLFELWKQQSWASSRKKLDLLPHIWWWIPSEQISPNKSSTRIRWNNWTFNLLDKWRSILLLHLKLFIIFFYHNVQRKNMQIIARIWKSISWSCWFLHPFSCQKIRLWKSSTINGSPSLKEIFGSHFRRSFAFVISGFLLCGSSAVFSLNSIFALESIVSFTTCQN